MFTSYTNGTESVITKAEALKAIEMLKAQGARVLYEELDSSYYYSISMSYNGMFIQYSEEA